MFGFNGRGAEDESRRERKHREESPEYLLGAEIIGSVTSELGCTAEEAYALLSETKRPLGREAVCARAARELQKFAGENEGVDVEKFLEDEGFISLLPKMPADAAIRVYLAECAAREADEKLLAAQERGRSDILEKLRARREMPVPVRTAAAAALAPDFLNMTSEEFKAAKERLRR